jgi:hypothetical protein
MTDNAQRIAALDGVRRLAQLVPEWTDTGRARQEIRAVRSYLMRKGFSAPDAASLADPHALAIARKAMLYDADSQQGPSPATDDQLMARLRQTGRVEDAAAVIEQMMQRPDDV